jgi:hypothetical protein
VLHGLHTAATYPAFAARLTALCLQALLRREAHEGVHHDVLMTLREDLPGWTAQVTQETVLRLVAARSSAAQEAGGLVLLAHSQAWGETFDITALVPLANHAVRTIREASWALFTYCIPRCRRATNPAGYAGEMAKAIRLLDAQWDDAREHWFTVFREQFQTEDFTPEALVNLCDSPQEAVQQFGRALLMAHFQDVDGPDYMLKLSEHPSAAMQLFVTNYLERYAADNVERLRQLTPYVVSALSLVNRGRVAKDRLFAFLTTEALKNAEAAQWAAEILTRQSVTMAIGDKATTLEAMLAIHRLYPHIPLPLQVIPVEVRHAV